MNKKEVSHSEGYLVYYLPKHKLANKNGYVFVHRLKMQKELLKYKNPSKLHVHHIDGNKKNNKKNNLMIVTPLTHHRLEKGWKLIENKWYKICKDCNRFLEVNITNFYERKRENQATGFINVCKKCNIKDIIKKRLKKASR